MGMKDIFDTMGQMKQRVPSDVLNKVSFSRGANKSRGLVENKEVNNVISEIMRVDSADLIYGLLANLRLNEPHYFFSLSYAQTGGSGFIEKLLHDFKIRAISDEDFVVKVKKLIKGVKMGTDKNRTSMAKELLRIAKSLISDG